MEVETTVGDGITADLDPSQVPRWASSVVIDVAAETFERTHHGTHALTIAEEDCQRGWFAAAPNGHL